MLPRIFETDILLLAQIPFVTLEKPLYIITLLIYLQNWDNITSLSLGES